MVLVFVRHGPAGGADAARWPDDRDRPLTPKGIARTRRALKGLTRLVRHADRIWTSPLARARETAELARRAWSASPPVETLDELAPGGHALPLLREWIRRAHDETLVVLGHEPDLSSLAAALTGLKTGGLELKKAGAIGLAIEPGAGPGAATLTFLLPPRALRALARKGVGERDHGAPRGEGKSAARKVTA
jgi:phosphohistidine phosphatase